MDATHSHDPGSFVPAPRSALRRWLAEGWLLLRGWFDSSSAAGRVEQQLARDGGEANRVDWVRVTPFLALHASCLLVFVVGWSPVALAACALLYLTRMFAITAFYHRYFSHRSFRTSRAVQFLMALAGSTATQRGPLWWAAHHRKHHRHADSQQDVHSPLHHGVLWSHVGWITSPRNYLTDLDAVPDLARYPELRWINRFDSLAPLALAASLFALGTWLEAVAPQLGTSGPQLFVWGFLVSTVLLFHATSTINSLAHRFGERRYAIADESRNNGWLAALTLGEGWHNNHHRYPHSTRQGFHWTQPDPTWWALLVLERLGIVRDLRPVPEDVLAEGHYGRERDDTERTRR